MEEDLTISQIAFENLSKVSLTAIIDRFEELNLAKRVPSKLDRRKTIITLTENGRRCPSTLRHQHGIEVKQWRQSLRLC